MDTAYTVVSPQGQPPARRLLPMAPRLDSLHGKTVYIVDLRWPYTGQFCTELGDALSSRFADSKFVVRQKAGGYGEDDPGLWAEVKERGDAAVVGVGH